MFNWLNMVFCRDMPAQGRLQVGPFTISPAFAMIMPGTSTTVSVEYIPDSDVPRKFEEVIQLFYHASNVGLKFDNFSLNDYTEITT